MCNEAWITTPPPCNEVPDGAVPCVGGPKAKAKAKVETERQTPYRKIGSDSKIQMFRSLSIVEVLKTWCSGNFGSSPGFRIGTVCVFSEVHIDSHVVDQYAGNE